MERAKHRSPQRPVRMRQGCRLTGPSSSVRVLHARSWFGFEPPRHSAFSHKFLMGNNPQIVLLAMNLTPTDLYKQPSHRILRYDRLSYLYVVHYLMVILLAPGISSMSNFSNSTSFIPGGIGLFPINEQFFIIGLIPTKKHAC